ncbi:MAG: hypothetical protein ACPGIA_05585 [Luteolibacter sp.]
MIQFPLDILGKELCNLKVNHPCLLWKSLRHFQGLLNGGNPAVQFGKADSVFLLIKVRGLSLYGTTKNKGKNDM